MKNGIAKVISELYGLDVDVVMTRPDPAFGDYASNVAFNLSKPLGKNPREIAQSIAEKLQTIPSIESANVAGPGFINIKVSAVSIADQLNDAWSDSFGENNSGAGKTVVVEYPSQNMAKPYSVGHLRPGNQGWAAKRLMEVSGWNVITDNHLGDYGAPFGIWVVGFLRFSSDEQLAKDGVYELGRVYIETKQALKDEEARGESTLANEVQDWLLKLEAGDAQAKAYSERFNSISLEHIHDVMGRLGIATEYEYGEAFFAPKGKEAVKRLLDEGIAVQNEDGSVIVPLDEFGFDVPLLIQKSNGAALYATTDLATLLFREQQWKPDRIIHSVGAEQKFYFRQLFALAKKLGIETELIHLDFGIIDQKNPDGTREKMSSRRGVVLMETLLDTAEQKAREVVAGHDVSEEDTKKVALGAIKFSDFMSDRRVNILFDWDSIFALTGFSGPYVQYAAVRVNKILRDIATESSDVGDYDYQAEKSILLKINDYPAVVQSAANDLEPHKIARYLYDLAREMNRYYEVTRVGEAEQSIRAARLQVLKKVSHVFSHGLGILGIEVPERM